MIAPAVEKFGYVVIRADKIAEPGIITSQIIQHIIDDPLVIADLTDHNPNVFYELAVRHVIQKPFIQLIKKGDQIPFDVAGLRTIQFDHKDLDSVDSAKNELINQIVVTTQVSLRGAFFATKQSPRNNSGTTMLGIASQTPSAARNDISG